MDDAFPDDSSESTDTDLDGFGNNIDPDDDNDGKADQEETDCGSDPLDPESLPPDEDGDGTCDLLDTNEDDTNQNNSGSTEDTSGGFPVVAIAGIVVVILVLGGVGAFLFTRSGSETVTGASMAASESTTSTSQQGEMIPTDRVCGKCGAPGLVFIPAYQRHYCRVCSQYE